MNIKEAKQTVKDAIHVYLAKDGGGRYRIPVNRQRPLALIGPAGVGKTDIVRQAAAEMDVAFLSYTITHHTRQSIMGLPRLEQREYGGTLCHVTGYTMSEIISEIYETMERTGKKEGVLFLDEFNCASETIAPLMLQFLQNKTFGCHSVPEGWVVVLAGNPGEYNRSARETDVVTRDRIREIHIEPSFDAWREYAVGKSVHPTILAYLSQNRSHFYYFANEKGELHLATARGWEELSQMIRICEEENLPVDAGLAEQYLPCPKIAGGFINYYKIFNEIVRPEEVETILKGKASGELRVRFRNKPFDVRCALIWLLSDRLLTGSADYAAKTAVCDRLYAVLTAADTEQPLSGQLREPKPADENNGGLQLFSRLGQLPAAGLNAGGSAGEKEGNSEGQRPAVTAEVERILGKYRELAEETEPASGFEKIRGEFSALVRKREQARDLADEAVTNTLNFVSQVFGEGSEMEILLNNLDAAEDVVRLLAETGNSRYIEERRAVFAPISKGSVNKRVKEALNKNEA
ncbi:AAA family ATPase [Bacilliculturomica massiliensis]|uniref:AAA family ATPase n=1 Tax=Bacilliculturomica massiliensis TaxID=1917867 RepID=UPI001031EB18|nr:AAA family ATPase [Bacilliculturomica massiliensis]